MNNFFQKQFEEEFLKSEQIRTKILTGVFSAGMLFSFINYLIYEKMPSLEMNKQSYVYIFTFMTVFAAFELLSLLYINRHLKQKVFRIPAAGQYINAAIEILSPGVIMFILSSQFSTPMNVLHSPAAYIYFIFIILSTLRLNFKISLFTGLMAAASFFTLNILVAGKYGQVGMIDYRVLTAKVIVLTMSGVVAGVVARQIKKSIHRSLAAAEHGNRVASLFGKQVSKAVVDEMLKGDGNIMSRMMNVCIMFIDIRNFTQHVAHKSPSEIVQYQNIFFSLVVKAVTKHGGIVNQFLGDGCMITFGAPVAMDNPCEPAVMAALEIKQQMQEHYEKGLLPFKNIGAGIHAGDAVTGNIGTEERQQYSITGSVVILASRIEQLNKEYNSQILVSETVFQKAGHTVAATAEFINKAAIKGWNEPVAVYKIA